MILAFILKAKGGKKMGYSSTEVAWEMLKQAKSKGLSLTNLQLQKLVYISHGYMLGWKNRPLSSDTIEAWEYGPVIDKMYHEFKASGRNPIEVDESIETDLSEDEDALYVVRGVLDKFGSKSASDLVNLTHQQDTPWTKVWSRLTEHDRSVPIPDDLIKAHYRKLISSIKVRGL